MDTINGRSGFSCFASINSRQMASDALADPPGLSMRSTMARTDESFLAARMASTSVSDPIDAPFNGSLPPRPSTIAPDA